MTDTLEIVVEPDAVFSQLFSEEDLIRTNREQQDTLVACTNAAFDQFRKMVSPLIADLQMFDVGVDARLSDVLKSDNVRVSQETQLVFSMRREVTCAHTFPTKRNLEPTLTMIYSLDMFTDAWLHLSTTLLVKVGASPESLFASGPCGYSTNAELPDIERMLQDAYEDLRANIPAAISALTSN